MHSPITLRSLKGAPLSTLVALHLANTSLPNKDLLAWTGYSDKTIAHALDLLHSMGLVVHDGRRLGWSLTHKGSTLFHHLTGLSTGASQPENGATTTHTINTDDPTNQGTTHPTPTTEENQDNQGATPWSLQQNFSATGLDWNTFNLAPTWVETDSPPHRPLPTSQSRTFSASLSSSSKTLIDSDREQSRRQKTPKATTKNTAQPHTPTTSPVPSPPTTSQPTHTAVATHTTSPLPSPPTPPAAPKSHPTYTAVSPTPPKTTTTPQTTTQTIQTTKTPPSPPSATETTPPSQTTTSPRPTQETTITYTQKPPTFYLLRQAGVGLTMSDFLCQLDWVTPAYVRAHLNKIKRDNHPLNYAIHRMREGDPMPFCACGRCPTCQEHTYERMGITDVICR